MEKELRLRDPCIGNLPIIPPLEESDEIIDQDKKTILLQVYGEGVDLDLVETNQIQCPETLCRGLVFNDYGRYTIFVEVDGKRIQPDFNNVTRIPKEFITSKEWISTKKLDWNRCIYRSLDGEFCCDIEVDGEFNEKLLQYNVVYPASIRVGRKVYRYNRPILTGVNYNGKDYKLLPLLRPVVDEWTLDGFEIPKYERLFCVTALVATAQEVEFTPLHTKSP
jgi:hypothetical protein